MVVSVVVVAVVAVIVNRKVTLFVDLTTHTRRVGIQMCISDSLLCVVICPKYYIYDIGSSLLKFISSSISPSNGM